MGEFSPEVRAKSIATRKRKAQEREASLAQWFWNRVSKSEGCWTWTGLRTRAGYGHVSFAGRRWRYAHRIAWELTNGPIPDGLLVCHRCDNPGCVRPEHLFLGTNADNMRDMAQKGRDAFTRYPELRPRGNRHWTRQHPERLRRGEQNNKARLTAEQVLALRNEYARGVSQSALARKYGVRQASVWRIVHGYTWKHVAGAGSCQP